MCLYFFLDVLRLTFLEIVVDFVGAIWYSITIERGGQYGALVFSTRIPSARTLGNHEEKFGCRQVARR